MLSDNPRQALTFDDVLLVPAYSEVLPADVDVRTYLTGNIRLNLPLMSAAMDTVTEHGMAITMARLGGIGVIHKNFSIEDQAREVNLVKRSQAGMIPDPVVVRPDQKLYEVRDLMELWHISGVPVLNTERVPVGILTARDLRFEKDLSKRVSDAMTPQDKLITVSPHVSLDRARDLLHEHRIEKLLVVDEFGKLAGLITIKDLLQAELYPNAVKDDQDSLLVAAAIGPAPDYLERTRALVQAGADVIVIDTAHAHSRGVMQCLESLRKELGGFYPIIVGNMATKKAAQACINGGASAIKVGIGPGSICTTRIVAGVGVPQITAIADCAEIAKPNGVTVIADGGIKYSGDIAKAFAAGADVVMIGSLFAGTDETPGDIILYQGRSFKAYRGMGSLGAMKKGSKDRYGQADTENKKLVPEGIEGRTPYRGPAADVIHQLIGGVRSGMGYTGCRTIGEMQKNAQFIRQSPLGLKESHVHDVTVTEDAPNYRHS